MRLLLFRYTSFRFRFLSFGVIGFFIGSFIIANLFVYVITNIFKPKSIFKLLFATLMMYFILQFEKDFIQIVLGWVRLIPVLIILSLIFNLKYTEKNV